MSSFDSAVRAGRAGGCWESDPCVGSLFLPTGAVGEGVVDKADRKTKALVGDVVGLSGRRAPSRPQAWPEAHWPPGVSPSLSFLGLGRNMVLEVRGLVTWMVSQHWALSCTFFRALWQPLVPVPPLHAIHLSNLSLQSAPDSFFPPTVASLSSVCSFIRLSPGSFIHSLVCSFTHSLCPLVSLFILSFVHWLIHSLVYLFIVHSCSCLLVQFILS